MLGEQRWGVKIDEKIGRIKKYESRRFIRALYKYLKQ